jgi:hypothetical protein
MFYKNNLKDAFAKIFYLPDNIDPHGRIFKIKNGEIKDEDD